MMRSVLRANGRDSVPTAVGRVCGSRRLAWSSVRRLWRRDPDGHAAICYQPGYSWSLTHASWASRRAVALQMPGGGHAANARKRCCCECREAIMQQVP